MKTYDSYEAAKIANPEFEINRHVNSEKIECFTVGLFASVSVLPLGGDMIFYNQRCEPSSFCPTVASFFSDGFLLDDGDVYINAIGGVRVVGSDGNSVRACNEGGILNPSACYILRAAALEEKKPRTKVEYVKCEFGSVWEAVKAFEDGEVFHTHFMTDGWVIVEHVQQVIPNLQVEKLYRRIETPMTEREEFIESVKAIGITFFDGSKLTSSNIEHLAKEIYDSGKFKLVN